jgi:hypothetical protein
VGTERSRSSSCFRKETTPPSLFIESVFALLEGAKVGLSISGSDVLVVVIELRVTRIIRVIKTILEVI